MNLLVQTRDASFKLIDSYFVFFKHVCLFTNAVVNSQATGRLESRPVFGLYFELVAKFLMCEQPRIQSRFKPHLAERF